jgi:MerR family transcriptional regulator, thiopeptide resistance regulator
MLSVSQVAKRCGLSRTTVLYYEACGLVKPGLRSAAGYRFYGERELRVLEQVRLYRSVGMSVKDIRQLLAGPDTDAALLLKRRLRELDLEIVQLRAHQQAILRLLRGQNTLRRIRNMTKEKWVGIMKASGFKETDMHRWHREFERAAPEEHQEFLQYLHIPAEEIRSIRDWSRKPESA